MSKTFKAHRIVASTRQPESRLRRERLWRMALMAVGLAGVLAIGLFIYGLLVERVLPLRQVTGRVTLDDGQTIEITRGAFHNRVRFERSRYGNLAPNDPAAAEQLADIRGFGQMALKRMMIEALIRQQAAVRQLAVSEEEIDRYIKQAYGFLPEAAAASQAGAPATAEANALAGYRRDQQTWTRYGIDERAFRDIVRVLLLENKLRQALGDQAFQTWVEAQHARMTWLAGWEQSIPSEP